VPYHIAPEIVINATLYALLVFSLMTWTLIFSKAGNLLKTVRTTNNTTQHFGMRPISKPQNS